MTEIWLLISAGSGPKECAWVVDRLATTLMTEADKQSIGAERLAVGSGEERLPPSLMVRLQGEGAADFAASNTGSVRWVGQSPFRPHHKRKNWFVSVTRMPPPESLPRLDERDISYEAMKAGGPGGQHVNTTDSAVRATHGPTGIVGVAREERSQHANRKLARMKIALALSEREQEAGARAREDQWSSHQGLERGNAVRTFEGPGFKPRGRS